MIYECYCCNPLSNVSVILTKQFNTKVQFFTIDMHLVMNLVTQFMGDSRINHFSMVWCNQTEALFQYRIHCIIGRCRGIAKPRDLYIFLSLWNLACGSAPTCRLSEQYDIWSTRQSHDLKSYEEELTCGLMFDIACVWTMNLCIREN